MKKLIMASITTVVVIVVLAGTLIPILDDATATSDTFTNDGYFRMNKVTDGNFTFTWSYDTPNTINVNDETIQYTNNNGIEISVVCSEAFYLRIRDNNASFIYNGPGGNIVADSAGETLTVTIANNSGSVTNGTDTTTFTNVGDIYHISNSGDYAMKKANEIAYMNGDSEIFIRGVSRIGTHYVSFVVSGSVDDGPTILGSSVTVENAKMNATADNSHIDLYEFSSVTFDATYTGESTSTAVTYNYVVVPYEVSAERSVHFTDGQNAIFAAIPVMIILAVLLGVVALVLRSRMD